MFRFPVQNELGAILSLYLTYIHISRKVVVALPPAPLTHTHTQSNLKPERTERRPAPVAPSIIPVDAPVAAANSTADNIHIHTHETSGQVLYLVGILRLHT